MEQSSAPRNSSNQNSPRIVVGPNVTKPTFLPQGKPNGPDELLEDAPSHYPQSYLGDLGQKLHAIDQRVVGMPLEFFEYKITRGQIHFLWLCLIPSIRKGERAFFPNPWSISIATKLRIDRQNVHRHILKRLIDGRAIRPSEEEGLGLFVEVLPFPWLIKRCRPRAEFLEGLSQLIHAIPHQEDFKNFFVPVSHAPGLGCKSYTLEHSVPADFLGKSEGSEPPNCGTAPALIGSGIGSGTLSGSVLSAFPVKGGTGGKLCDREKWLMDRICRFVEPGWTGNLRVRYVRKYPAEVEKALDDVEQKRREGFQPDKTWGQYLTDLIQQFARIGKYAPPAP